MAEEVELALDAKADLGEGAIWDVGRGVLYWVDIMAGAVHVFDPASGKDRFVSVGEPVGTVVPRRAGGVAVAVKRGFAALDLDSGRFDMLAVPNAHPAENRFNDGKCDPAGRFWAGTMATSGPREGRASLYCLFPDRSVKKMLDGVTTSNGIAWSLDRKTMYYIDTPTLTVWAFDYDEETAAISNRRPAVSAPKEMGYPDGMTIDAEGMLWVAYWQGARVARWDPKSGRLLQTIRVPADLATSCAFGGPKLDALYITTARMGLKPEALASQSHAGGIFVAYPGAMGVKAFEFAG